MKASGMLALLIGNPRHGYSQIAPVGRQSGDLPALPYL